MNAISDLGTSGEVVKSTNTGASTVESISRDQTDHSGIWAMIAVLIVLKVLFAGVIFVFATDGAGDVSSLPAQAAIHWTPITFTLVAVPAALIQRRHARTIAHS